MREVLARIVEVDLQVVVDPGSVFRALRSRHGDAFWLDGRSHGVSYLGWGRRVDCRNISVSDLKREISSLSESSQHSAPPGLGLLGWFSYDFARRTTGLELPSLAGQESRFLRVDEVIAVDRRGSARLLLREGRSVPDVAMTAQAVRDWLRSVPGVPVRRTRHQDSRRIRPDVSWRDSETAYLDKIGTCQRLITNGEAYQLCLTTQAEINTEIDPYSTFLALRRRNASQRCAHIHIGGTSLLSISPEQFLSVDANGLVQTSPIKGTRPRSRDDKADRRQRTELVRSEKERAENVMIVDLMRNDLGRVCELGSVRVSSLLRVESNPHVHHLVSTVEGTLRDGLDALDVLAACFPAGSMTGAPRERAIELLNEVETGPRGAYAGAFGFFGFDGSAELSMTIRSIVITDRQATIGTGGGITAMSKPHEEARELRWKAAVLVESLRLAQS